MSVHLHTLKDPEQLPVEIWAGDYSVANVWLIYASEDDVGDRIDLSLDQLRQLRDVANGILGD